MAQYTDNDQKLCVLCRQKKKNGIRINSGFICDECEHEIVNTDVLDEKYPVFIERMKDLWLKDA